MNKYLKEIKVLLFSLCSFVNLWKILIINYYISKNDSIYFPINIPIDVPVIDFCEELQLILDYNYIPFQIESITNLKDNDSSVFIIKLYSKINYMD